jgi:hypothetical protein
LLSTTFLCLLKNYKITACLCDRLCHSLLFELFGFDSGGSSRTGQTFGTQTEGNIFRWQVAGQNIRLATTPTATVASSTSSSSTVSTAGMASQKSQIPARN